MIPNDLLDRSTMTRGLERFGDLAALIRSEFPDLATVPFIIVESTNPRDQIVRAFAPNDYYSPLSGRQTIAINMPAEAIDPTLLHDMVVSALFEAVNGEPPTVDQFPGQADVERFRPPPMGKFQVEPGWMA